ncbi:response regulator transcription factor [Streptomyces cavernae]|uniref:response regulator transcription factor n=1 Tax=Streptomyces cavernae TaxID=2259034 RepID=UPI001EE44904|nr:response regulator transcription factor [Streptomyces cavernae]
MTREARTSRHHREYPPLAHLTAALACAEGDWPHDDWPGPYDPVSAHLLPPPYDEPRWFPRTPDVVVLRCGEPLDELPALLAALGAEPPPVLVISPVDEPAQVVGALREGAVSYLVDADYTPGGLTQALQGTALRHSALSPRACEALTEAAQRPDHGGGGPGARGGGPGAARLRALLSPRESQIMELMSIGLGASEIGRRLCLSEKTVRNNLSNVYAKLGARGGTDAVLMWLGIVRAMPGSLV